LTKEIANLERRLNNMPDSFENIFKKNIEELVIVDRLLVRNIKKQLEKLEQQHMQIAKKILTEFEKELGK